MSRPIIDLNTNVVTSVIEIREGDVRTFIPLPGTVLGPVGGGIGDKFNGVSYDRTSAEPPSKSNLIGHANLVQSRIANAGLLVKLPSASVIVDTDVMGRLDLNRLVISASSDPAFSTVWVQNSGCVVLTSSQIMDVSSALESFIAKTYETLAVVIEAINDRNVTEFDQVDNPRHPLMPWPKNA